MTLTVAGKGTWQHRGNSGDSLAEVGADETFGGPAELSRCAQCGLNRADWSEGNLYVRALADEPESFRIWRDA